jgi:SH3 domain protein
MYVGEERFSLTLRSGPGNERKIIDLLPIGEALEVLEDGEEWILVRAADGKEGWVLKRYLDPERPNNLRVVDLKNQTQGLETQTRVLKEENTALKQENEKLSAALAEKTSEMENFMKDYKVLKRESDAKSFELQRYLIFFFSGGAILFIGIILGLVMKRQRRKSLYMI